MLSTPQLFIVNESSHVSGERAWNLSWALAYQIRWQAGPLLKIAADIKLLAPNAPIPSGGWLLHLMDKLPEAEGSLGYHDADGAEVPYGRIGVEATLDAKLTVEEVTSHEALELLADAHVNLTAFDERSKRLYPYELCDPCQGFSYDLGAPYGRTTGITVADFVLPGWFDDNTPADQPTDYRGGLKGPFSLGKAGYVSYTTTLPPNWQQEFGEHANRAVADADDRLQRRARSGVPS